MAEGIVKFFKLRAGHGFITPTVEGPDIFVHETEVFKAGLTQDDVKEGQRIEFDLVDEGRRWTRAVNLRLPTQA